MIQASPLTPFYIMRRKWGWRLVSAAVAPSRVCFAAEGVCGVLEFYRPRVFASMSWPHRMCLQTRLGPEMSLQVRPANLKLHSFRSESDSNGLLLKIC